jgi:hypothetical protein
MGILSRLLGRGTSIQKTTASNPLRIKDPSIGFLNLLGAQGAHLGKRTIESCPRCSGTRSGAPALSRDARSSSCMPRSTDWVT